MKLPKRRLSVRPAVGTIECMGNGAVQGVRGARRWAIAMPPSRHRWRIQAESRSAEKLSETVSVFERIVREHMGLPARYEGATLGRCTQLVDYMEPMGRVGGTGA